MPTDAKGCRENNWYCTAYTYKYRGKHVYRYSTSVEHYVTLKTSMHVVIACVCFSAFLADECLLVVESHAHLASHSCVVPRTPAHYHHTVYCSPSLQLLHHLTLQALHRLRPPLSPSPACPCGKQHVSGPCIVRACMSPCV